MLGQLGFVTWTPEAERKRLIVEKLTTTSKKQQNLANMPGYFERADELLCLQPPENTPGYIEEQMNCYVFSLTFGTCAVRLNKYSLLF